MSSIHASFLPAFAALEFPRTCKVVASKSFAVPFLSPKAMYFPSDDQSSAVGSWVNYSEHCNISLVFHTLTVLSPPQDANSNSVG